MEYKSITIANYFLDIARDSGEFITPMKLQKLIYFAHGCKLAITDSSLIDENIEVWEYGAVIPSIYHSFRKFKGNPITEELLSKEEKKLDNFTIALLNKVWEIYGKITSIKLSEITHLPDSPYKISKNMGSKTIDNLLIKNYFKNSLNEK